jgi:hypothetical protein
MMTIEEAQMNNTNTGGPAFPLSTVDPYDRSVTTCDGMTLRDYFAAKAMEGMLSDTALVGTPDEFAIKAYAVADAMLSARGTEKARES